MPNRDYSTGDSEDVFLFEEQDSQSDGSESFEGSSDDKSNAKLFEINQSQINKLS